MRNQRLKASQASHQLEIWLIWAGEQRAVTRFWGDELLVWRRALVREATVKACGVTVAMLQGHSWAPTLSRGSRVNVGTIPAAPSLASSLLGSGKIRRRLIPPGWDGGPVVVRDRESRSHGEGAQRVRSIKAKRGGRR